MKTQFALVFITLFTTVSMFAQQGDAAFVSKKGTPILPETGDYSIGIDATPFFRYFGNFLNGTAGNTAPTFGYTAANPLIISGKKMIDANTAYRGMFRIGFSNDKYNEYVNDDANTTATTTWVTDSKSTTAMNVALGVGLEKRRGKGRLQGIYGAQAMLAFSTLKNKYTYGNTMSTTTPTPTSYDWTMGTSAPAAYRGISAKQGTGIGFAVQGFVGAEYFFAPKFSVSGELLYGFGFVKIGEGAVETEGMNTAGTAIETVTTNTGSESHFGLDTGVSGVLNLNFYF